MFIITVESFKEKEEEEKEKNKKRRQRVKRQKRRKTRKKRGKRGKRRRKRGKRRKTRKKRGKRRTPCWMANSVVDLGRDLSVLNDVIDLGFSCYVAPLAFSIQFSLFASYVISFNPFLRNTSFILKLMEENKSYSEPSNFHFQLIFLFPYILQNLL